MGNFLERHNKRLGKNGKIEDMGDAYANNTSAFIDSNFHASPTFRVLKVKSTEFPNITEIDARVIEVERMGTLREVLFRPQQGLNVGTYVTFDDDTWLAFDKWGSTKTATGLKLMVEKCNRILKWNDKDGVLKTIDCIASATPLGSKANQGRNDIEWNKYDVRLPLGQLFVFFEANDLTKTIKMNQRFIFGSNVYEVFGIDDTTLVDENGFGVVQLTIKVTTRQNGDDFTNGIAINHYDTDYNPEVPPTDDDEGGMIW